MSKSPYQLLPDLLPEEYETLKASIAERRCWRQRAWGGSGTGSILTRSIVIWPANGLIRNGPVDNAGNRHGRRSAARAYYNCWIARPCGYIG